MDKQAINFFPDSDQQAWLEELRAYLDERLGQDETVAAVSLRNDSSLPFPGWSLVQLTTEQLTHPEILAPSFDLVFNLEIPATLEASIDERLQAAMRRLTRKHLLVLEANLDNVWAARQLLAANPDASDSHRITHREVAPPGMELVETAQLAVDYDRRCIVALTSLTDEQRQGLLAASRLTAGGPASGALRSRLFRHVPVSPGEGRAPLPGDFSAQQRMEIEIKDLRGALNERDYQISLLSEENQTMLERLNDIYSSKAWKLIVMLWKVRLTLLPHNSRLERAWNSTNARLAAWAEAARSWMEGWSSKKWQVELEKILARHAGASDILIFAPGIEWDLPLFQRPQHLANAISHLGILTFYCEPRDSKMKRGFHAVQERLYISHVPMRVYRAIPSPVVVFLSYNAIWKKYFTQPRVIYDYIDELNVFPGNYMELQKRHQEFLETASLVVATAKRLHEQVAVARPDALLAPNGVDYAHFHRDELLEPPADIRFLIEKRKPIIGYYGALARWFDYPLLQELARQRRDLSFLLIGPAYDNSLAKSNINAEENIHWIGPRDYRDLPAYLSAFDVAMIPFALSPITHSTSPLKLFEFMAGGKPVVVTPMHESMRIEGVLTAHNAAEFSDRIDQALMLRHDPNYLALIDRVARENTWEQRARQIIAALRPDLPGIQPAAESRQP